MQNRLRLARVRQGWTQAQLAEIVGVTRAAVTAWEAGRRIPRPRTVYRLQQILQDVLWPEFEPPKRRDPHAGTDADARAGRP